MAHSPYDLNNTGPLAFSPAQIKQAQQESPVGYGPRPVLMPLSALTPAQQQAARQKIALFNEHRDHYVEWLKEGESLTLDGKIKLNASPKLELIVPSLTGPVSIEDGSSLEALFQLSREMQNKMWEAGRQGRCRPRPLRRSQLPHRLSQLC